MLLELFNSWHLATKDMLEHEVLQHEFWSPSDVVKIWCPAYSALQPSLCNKASEFLDILFVIPVVFILFRLFALTFEVLVTFANDMAVAFSLQRFLKEYGPIIWDVVFSLPPVWFYRMFRTHYSNLSIAKEDRPSLLCLPDELIMEVCHLVMLSGCPSSQTTGRQCDNCSRSRLALVNISKTNKRIRDLTAPLILQNAKIGQGHGWLRAYRSLKTVELSSHVTYCTNEVSVGIYAPSKWPWPPWGFVRRLSLVLPAVQKLEKLVLNLPPLHIRAFRKGFKNNSIQLPSVRTLILGPHTEWIISMCPNVEVISTSGNNWLHSNVDGDHSHRHSFDLVRAAGHAKKLRHFEMMEWWRTEYISAILNEMPDIESLAMPGGSYAEGIATMLPILTQFCRLRMVVLADAAELHVRFRRRYSRVCLPPHRVELIDTEGMREAEQDVAQMVFGSMKDLEELWVGNHSKATISRRVTGSIEAISWNYGHRLVANRRY